MEIGYISMDMYMYAYIRSSSLSLCMVNYINHHKSITDQSENMSHVYVQMSSKSSSCLLYVIILHHSTSFYISLHHSTSFYIILHHSTSFYIILHHNHHHHHHHHHHHYHHHHHHHHRSSLCSLFLF